MALSSAFSLSKARLLGASALFTVLLCLPVCAQNEGSPLPANLVAIRDNISDQRYFWCAGVADQGDLDAYVADGFDTLVLPLPWRTGDDGALFDTNFGSQRALATEGARRGLKIIFSLSASPEGLGATRVSADSPSYTALWTNWAQSALDGLAGTPNLAGWMLPNDSRALATFDDAGFRRYLASHFASIETLNARWGTTYTDYDSISISDVETLVSMWKSRTQSDGKGALPPLGALGATADPNGAFVPAALSLADYKANSWKELMSLWASTLRGMDTKRPIFSGTCPDYAQLLAMPEGVDVSVASIPPNVAEPDVVTHNPQAVDIARRAGAHAAVAQLSIQPRPDLSATSMAQLLPRWVDSALAHGARGVSFDSFDALERNPVLSDAISKTLTRVKSEPLEKQAPIATTAVLLEPLAEGATLQLGQSPDPRGLYGFGEGLVEGEPSTLVASLRWGTAFGGVDYLSPDDLEAVDLSRYSTILAPQLLNCPPETTEKLAEWMRSGGTFVTDLGLGALQNGGSATALPPQMALLAGGIGPFELRQTAFNVRGASSTSLLPTWSKQFDSRPGMMLSHGNGEADTAFEGPAGFALPAPKAIPIAIGPSLPSTPTQGAYNGANAPVRAQVTLSLSPVERGYFVFAPFRLWALWRPGQFGFDPFHGDILARGADLAVSTDALTPFPVGTQLGLTRFPEIVNRDTSITLLNHDAAGGPQNVAIDATGSGDWLWSNAIVRMLPASAAVLNGGRPAPIESPNELEARSRALSLYTITSPAQKLVCRMRPIAVQNLGGSTITAQITTEESGSLALKIWGATLQVSPQLNGAGWQPIAPDGINSFRLTVVDSSNGYRCPPGSKHRVSINDFGVPDANDKATRKKITPNPQIVVADAGGRLKIEFSGAACSVKIEPDTGQTNNKRGR
ncbi:hypothetical protein IAD21_05953 [Abditibacteriota bacterium]|nr:hypothetical protein IAD21_05953 [Abditibacteriota bacterium]